MTTNLTLRDAELPADGGPAFPRSYTADGHNGMTLRDWYAGQALAGLLSDPKMVGVEAITKTAFAFADGMLARRRQAK